MERVRFGVAAAIAAGLLAWGPPLARGDRITLRGGGEIKGVVVADPKQPSHVLIQTETAARPISFEKTQVVKVTREPGPLDDYLAQKDKVEQTAQAQYDFGMWCEESKITGPASSFYQKAIELDPQLRPPTRSWATSSRVPAG